MNKKFIFGIIVAILLLAPLASASILDWLGITGKVTEGKPDLVLGIELPSIINVGDLINLSVHVTNVGSAPVAALFDLNVLASDNVRGKDVTIASGWIGELVAGGFVIKSYPMRILDNTTLLRITVDTINSVDELNETNNELTKTIYVTHAITECTDSDGGKNYYTKGYVYGIDAKGNQYKYEDVCHGEYNPPKTGDLLEYYCEGDNYVSSYYHCPYGCSDGACLKAPPLTLGCTDTDDGKDYYKKGAVYGIDEEGKEYKNEDFCVDDKLMEHYCEFDKPTSEYFSCPEGCENGACIRTCPDITGWRIENGKCVSDSGCDYDASKYVYYASLEECQSHLECVPEWQCKVEPPFCPPSGMQTKICKDVKCDMEPKQEIIGCAVGQCSGCMRDTTCVPYGQRLKVKDISAYCSIDSVLRPQMPEGAECQNDYECLSNECSNGKCISTYSLLQKIWELLKAIFGKGWLWGK